MKRKSLVSLPLLLMGVILLLVGGCKKDAKVSIPTVSTAAISSITQTGASGGGIITSDGGATVTARGVCWSTSQNPTIANSLTIDDGGIGSYISSILGLNAGTLYYVRAYATNSAGTAYGTSIPFTTEAVATTVTDYDGNIYKTVKLGTQTWIASNLQTTKYNDGTTIPLVTDAGTWQGYTGEAYCNYNNTTSADSINKYGSLYNWYAVNTGKLCPTGWHIPSRTEWATFQAYLIANGYNYDGTTTGNKTSKAICSATTWAASTVSGTPGNKDYPTYIDKSGFTAVPGGFRNYYGVFTGIGTSGDFWDATDSASTASAYYQNLSNSGSTFFTGIGTSSYGFSIRCVKN